MVTSVQLLVFLLLISVILILIIMIFPFITATKEGKLFSFGVLFILPVIAIAMAATEKIEGSKETKFCLSCHLMEPYGKSLHVDDSSFLAAAHFQNHRVPADEACYTCHTDYALYGGVIAKFRGLRHIYAQYVENPKPPLHLYTPFNNRECLHCHAGARSFEEGATHNSDPGILPAIRANELSCVSAGCHEGVHNVSQLDKVKFWRAPNEP